MKRTKNVLKLQKSSWKDWRSSSFYLLKLLLNLLAVLFLYLERCRNYWWGTVMNRELNKLMTDTYFIDYDHYLAVDDNDD